MAKSEQGFIDLCKIQIEKKFSFGNGNGYTQRDLEVLAVHIEEKTGVKISLSTLKRLWKNKYKQSPQLATLNALAEVLDYRDWQGFKQSNPRSSGLPNPLLKRVLTGLSLVIVSVLAFVFLSKPQKKTKEIENGRIGIVGPVHFKASKTVTRGIPNTVVFNYDVTNVIADSFYIQQSWNPQNRVPIDPRGNALTCIYYESGFHRARLMANDSVIVERPVHILSDGWEPHLYYNESAEPINLKNELIISNGRLHLDSSMLARRNIDNSKRFHSRISNSQVFDVHSDNFSFISRMKVDDLFHELCPWMSIIIITEVNIFRVVLQNKGCEKYASYKLGEIEKRGGTNDLSALGCDVYDWQDLELKVEDKHASIYLNGELTYKEVYEKDFGKIRGLVYVFNGTGSIDYTGLGNAQGTIIFEDDFAR